MDGRTLQDIAGTLDTTKGRRRNAGTWPSLAEVYHRYFAGRRGDVRRVLEIGIERGGSLQMWAEYFPNADVWGVDRRLPKEGAAHRRVTMITGDQSDERFLSRLASDLGPLDLVLDDGSHQHAHQRLSLQRLWPAVAPGGIYVVEDVHTSYREPKYGGGLRKPGTFMEHLKDLLDDVHVKEHKGPELLGDLESVHVHFQTVLLFKQPVPRGVEA